MADDVSPQLSGYGWRPDLLYGQNFGLPPALDPRDLRWLESIVRRMESTSWPGYARASAFATFAEQLSSKVHREIGGGVSEVRGGRGAWKVSLDVNHFAPSEITVRTQGSFLEITGKHDERQDAHGYISRCFIRKYMLPVGVEAATIKSFLTGDGILSVEASFPDIPKPADVTIPVQVKIEAPVLQGKQDELPVGGCAAGQGLSAGEEGGASQTLHPPVPRDKPEGVFADWQSDADDALCHTSDLPADLQAQSSIEAGQEATQGIAEGQQEDDEHREAGRGEAGVVEKQEGAEEGLELARAAVIGVEESLEEPEAPPTTQTTGVPPFPEQSDLPPPEQPEALPTQDETGALQTPEQPEAPSTTEETEALQIPFQPEALPPPEETGALHTPEQYEIPSTPEQSAALQIPEQFEAPPTTEETGGLQNPEQPEAPPTPDTITSEQEESAEVEQSRELQEAEEGGETQHVEAEGKNPTPQEEVKEDIPPQLEAQEEIPAQLEVQQEITPQVKVQEKLETAK